MAIQMMTRLAVADNSGIKEVMCINHMVETHKRHASVGDVITVSVKDATPRGKVKPGEVYNAVVDSARI